eukprot:TRINITY_DN47242_c0_g1_i1.p1 TRINITY_DN47242_c0_g1~~TRINITY_DN47242_c0_g1_i1.p1  ORF type:complete len:1081 (-),score=242.82 TRINITY_DN47242_c0_g1_i1:561-3803(-)
MLCFSAPWLLVSAAAVAAVGQEVTCDVGLLGQLHERLEPAVTTLAEIHFNCSGSRHHEVVELISVYQSAALCKSALNFVESLRLTLAGLICPPRYAPVLAGSGVLTGAIKLIEHIDEFFDNVRFMAGGHGDAEVYADAAASWSHAEDELRHAAGRLEKWLEFQQVGEAQKLVADNFAGLEQLLQRILNMVVDFTRSINEDMATLFNTPNYVAREMLPPKQSPEAQSPSSQWVRVPHAGVNIFSKDGGDGQKAFNVEFLDMLRHPPAPLSQPGFFPTHRECAAAAAAAPSPAAASAALPFEFSAVPRTSAHRDISGAPQGTPSPLQLLRAAAQHTRLSDLFISLQVSNYLLVPKPKCGDKLVLYDPTLCLLEEKWAGYKFELNPLPPFNLTVVYAGKPLGPGVTLPPLDVHSIHVPSRDAQWGSMVSTYKSMNHHSPDLLYLSPFVGNCQIIDRLLSTGAVKPKLVYMPINPLQEPPIESVPNFFDYWEKYGDVFVQQIAGMHTANVDIRAAGVDHRALPITTNMWLAQCSLASADAVMRRQGYVLLHLEHTYAVFMWRPLHQKISKGARRAASEPGSVNGVAKAYAQSVVSMAAAKTKAEASATAQQSQQSGSMGGGAGRETVVGAKEAERDADPVALRAQWLAGWRCSPHSRYLFNLEAFVGVDSDTSAMSQYLQDTPPAEGPVPPTREELNVMAASIFEEVPTMRYFLGRPSASGRSTRGHCAEGICECFPPYRGRMCDVEDGPRSQQAVRAAIHYITAETERDMLDLERSLSTLWLRFNKQRDYPVLVFHEGLSAAARWRIVTASENRVWFVLLENFKVMPTEWKEQADSMASEFSLGYRAMIRWRSGPVFLEPALADFDFAMTLDTDSYFPQNFASDPFEVIAAEGLTAAFPHLGRESASVVVNFMHYFLLYCRLKNLHARRTEMLAALIERNFKWYQQCLMLDMEVVRLDFFRGQQYQDFFKYMDSTGGFWLHRWGNNPVRTFGVGLLLDDKDVRSLVLPYAHQDFCSCGANAEPCSWDASQKMYVCPEGQLGAFALKDLGEGLMHLQPWRGTDWQHKAFKEEDIRTFVEEQIPF